MPNALAEGYRFVVCPSRMVLAALLFVHGAAALAVIQLIPQWPWIGLALLLVLGSFWREWSFAPSVLGAGYRASHCDAELLWRDDQWFYRYRQSLSAIIIIEQKVWRFLMVLRVKDDRGKRRAIILLNEAYTPEQWVLLRLLAARPHQAPL